MKTIISITLVLAALSARCQNIQVKNNIKVSGNLTTVADTSILAGCNPPSYIGPPNYPCGSTSTANPGQISYLFNSTIPEGIINTSNAAISPCTANCMQWVSGDQFNTSWSTGIGAGNSGNIQIGGGYGRVNTSGTAVTWVSGTPFNTAWTGAFLIAGVSYTISSVSSTTALALTATAGTQTAAGYGKVGAAFGVSAWNSATVATLMSAPGTQTGVNYSDQTACLGAGCQNAVAEDTTIPGHVTGSNIITRITDGSSLPNGQPVGNLTLSGGDNDHMFSQPNGTYLWVGNNGGGLQPYEISVASGKVQVVNAGCMPVQLTTVQSGFSTSWTTERKFYYMASGSSLLEGNLTGSGCSLALAAPTTLVDFFGANVCPGVTPFTVVFHSILAVSSDDDTFAITLGPGGQETADWTLVWSRTKGCSTVSWKTGKVWAFCTSSCTSSTPELGTFATGNTNCWGSDGSTSHGLHNTQMSGDGLYVAASHPNSWSQGGCAGFSGSDTSVTFWQIGTLGNQWCSNTPAAPNPPGDLKCGGHQSLGISKSIFPQFSGDTIRSHSNIAAYTVFSNTLPFQDSHGAWPHESAQGVYDDTLPYISNSDVSLPNEKAGCTGTGNFDTAVYCPVYLGNVNFITFFNSTYPPEHTLTFTHTGACGFTPSGFYSQCADGIVDAFGGGAAIGIASAKGDIWCWASSMWHRTGYDRTRTPRIDAYCEYLGVPQ